MLDQDTIYRKSGKGSDAVATRQPSLSPRQRSMLIMVDGRRTVRELAAYGAALGDPGPLLSQLLEMGFIETATSRAGQPAAVPTAAAPSAGDVRPATPAIGPTQLRVPLEKAQTFAVTRLSDLLGPAGDDLCKRIQSTRNPHEFRAAVRRTETNLRQVVGPELAEQFVREVENLRAN